MFKDDAEKLNKCSIYNSMGIPSLGISSYDLFIFIAVTERKMLSLSSGIRTPKWVMFKDGASKLEQVLLLSQWQYF